MAFELPTPPDGRKFVKLKQSALFYTQVPTDAVTKLTALDARVCFVGRTVSTVGSSVTYAYFLLFKLPCSEVVRDVSTNDFYAAIPNYVNEKDLVNYFNIIVPNNVDDDSFLTRLPLSTDLLG